MKDLSSLEYDFNYLLDYPKNRFTSTLLSYKVWLLDLSESILSRLFAQSNDDHKSDFLSRIEHHINNMGECQIDDYQDVLDKLGIELNIKCDYNFSKNSVSELISSKLGEGKPLEFITLFNTELTNFNPAYQPLELYLEDLLEYGHSKLFINALKHLFDSIKSNGEIDTKKYSPKQMSRKDLVKSKELVPLAVATGIFWYMNKKGCFALKSISSQKETLKHLFRAKNSTSLNNYYGKPSRNIFEKEEKVKKYKEKIIEVLIDFKLTNNLELEGQQLDKLDLRQTMRLMKFFQRLNFFDPYLGDEELLRYFSSLLNKKIDEIISDWNDISPFKKEEITTYKLFFKELFEIYLK